MSEDYYKRIFSNSLKYYMSLNNKTQIDIINDLGVNNSAISTWYHGTRLPRMDKVDMLAKYFGISRSDLMEEKQLTNKDRKDISSILADTELLLKQEGLMFDGEPASPESIDSILSAMKIGMEMAKQKNKAKYTPKKYKTE